MGVGKEQKKKKMEFFTSNMEVVHPLSTAPLQNVVTPVAQTLFPQYEREINGSIAAIAALETDREIEETCVRTALILCRPTSGAAIQATYETITGCPIKPPQTCASRSRGDWLPLVARTGTTTLTMERPSSCYIYTVYIYVYTYI